MSYILKFSVIRLTKQSFVSKRASCFLNILKMTLKIALALMVTMVVAVAYAAGHGKGWGWSHPKYKYSYGVKDKHTHDQKHASEWRDGHNVRGYYSLREPDGSWRTVTYWADKGGFRAKVLHSHGHNHRGRSG